jgi:transposase
MVDSSVVKTTQVGGKERGFDGYKQVKGRKRHLLVDTLGLLLGVVVTGADVCDRKGFIFLWARYRFCHLLSKIQLLWADQGYDGAEYTTTMSRFTGWVIDIVRRKEGQKGFTLLPRRWVVERTFAWLSFCRRLSKDYERKTSHSESMIYAAMIRIMLLRLAT